MRNRQSAVRWARAGAILFVLLLLYLVLRSIGFRDIVRALRTLQARAVWCAVALTFGSFLVQALRWQLLMPREDRPGILAVFPILLAGVFGNLITPGARVGGEPIRSYYMSRAFGGEKSRYLGTILVDKFGNAAVFFLLLLLSVLLVIAFVPLAGPVKALLLLGALLMPTVIVSGFLLRERIGLGSTQLRRLLTLIYNGRLMKSLRGRFPTYEHFEDYAIRKLDNVFQPIRRAAVNPKAIVTIVLLTLASWLLMYLAHWMLFNGMNAPLGLLQVIVIVNVSVFCGDVSVSPGGAGFMETVMIGLCAAFGVDHEKAAAVTLISRGIFYAFGLGLGGVFLIGLSCIYGRRADEEA